MTSVSVVKELTKLLVSIVWIVLNFLTKSSYSAFLRTSFFTTSLRILKSTGVVSNLPISNSSISDFKLAKLASLVNFYVSTPVEYFKPCLAA